MNAAHLHLVLNHLPLVSIPLGLIFLLAGVQQGHKGWTKFSLWILIFASVLVLPVFLTGEPAEEVVEHLPGVGEAFIESHEGAAKTALVLTLLGSAASLSALGSFWSASLARLQKALISLTVIFSFLGTTSLGYTALLGGRIRHIEVRSGADVAGGTNGVKKLHEDEDKDGDKDDDD